MAIGIGVGIGVGVGGSGNDEIADPSLGSKLIFPLITWKYRMLIWTKDKIRTTDSRSGLGTYR